MRRLTATASLQPQGQICTVGRVDELGTNTDIIWKGERAVAWALQPGEGTRQNMWIRNEMTGIKEKIPKKGGHSSPEGLDHHVKINSACSGLYLSQVYGTWSSHLACTMYHVHYMVADKKVNACLSRANTATKRVFKLYTFNFPSFSLS